MTAQILTFQDLNTEVNHEPRILDIRIGEALRLERPRKIRDVITANMTELESYGSIALIKGGRSSTEYYLNEPQIVLLCMFSRTEKAAEVRKQVIDVFMAYRSGQLQPTELNLDDVISPHEQRMLQEAVKLKHQESGIPYPALYERIKNKFRIAKYNQCTRQQFAEVMFYVCNMDVKQKSLPAPAGVNDAQAISNKLKQLIMNVHDINVCFAPRNEALRSHTQPIVQGLEQISDMINQPMRFIPAQVLPATQVELLKQKSLTKAA